MEVKMTKARDGDKVKVHYTGKLNDGKIFETSQDIEPLEFQIGKGQLISGFEEAVVGMEEGETKTVKVPTNKAYGAYREDKVFDVKKSKIPARIKLEIGQRLKVQQKNGKTNIVKVTDISDTTVTLDANHPLAGKDLTFDIKLVKIV